MHLTSWYILPLSPALPSLLSFWKVQCSFRFHYLIYTLRTQMSRDSDTARLWNYWQSVHSEQCGKWFTDIASADVQLVSICFCLRNGRGTTRACTNYFIRFLKGWLRFGGLVWILTSCWICHCWACRLRSNAQRNWKKRQYQDSSQFWTC
jgi:hypothetical protein